MRPWPVEVSASTPLWSVALAVKPLAQAKSRLGVALSASARRDLALAMAQDVVSAVLGCPEVDRCVLVTADPVAAERLAALGAEVIAEPRPDGLDAAYLLARDQVGDRPLALVMADLPCLDPAGLAGFLASVPEDRVALVADVEGTGTTVLAARQAAMLRPRYGPGSRVRHLADGGVDLSEQSGLGLRQDVDTWETLQRIRTSGAAGAATTDWLRRSTLRGVA